MKLVQLVFKMSRPRFWLYIAGPYITGLIAAYKSGLLVEPVHLALIIFFLFPANFFIYSVNDFYDQDTDKLNPKKSTKEIKYYKEYRYWFLGINSAVIIFALLLLFLLPTGEEKLILSSFLLLAFFYSAPPVNFKRRPVLDALSNMFYFFPGLLALSHAHIFLLLIIIIALISWTSAMHLFSAIPDIDFDKKSHIRTTATMLGERKALWVCFALWLIFAGICTGTDWRLGWTFVYPLIIVWLLLQKHNLITKVYWYYPYLNSLLGFLFFIYLALIL